MYYDMHVHSRFSTDSQLSFADAVSDALTANLTGISFTDHLDIDFTNYEQDYQYDLNDYFTAVNEIRLRYQDQLVILTGVEIGIQPHVIDETLARVEPFLFDFILGSTHLVQKKDPYDASYFEHQNKKSVYSRYLQELDSNIRLYPHFDVLSHFDYLARYAPYQDATLYYQDHPELLDDIFRWLIEQGKGLEINSATYQKVPMDSMVLRRYRELGGEILTIGSDAHDKKQIGRKFTCLLEQIQQCGFRYVAHYRERTPHFTKIG